MRENLSWRRKTQDDKRKIMWKVENSDQMILGILQNDTKMIVL